ncbi:hypothetical protein [Nitrospira sp. Ecomares 2.1]
MSFLNSLTLLFREFRLLNPQNYSTPKANSTENHRELYLLAKEVFKEEQERLNRIDEKATRYLSALTVIIGTWGFFAKWIFESTLPPKNSIEWALVILALFSLILLFIAWWNALQVLRNSQLQKIPLTEETIKWFGEHSLPNIYRGMTEGIRKAKEVNRQVGNKKLRKLSLAFSLIMINGIVMLFLLLIFGIHTWESKSRISHPQEPEKVERKGQMAITKGHAPQPSEIPESNPSQEPGKPQEPKIDPNLIPPPFETVTEGFDPLKLPKGTTHLTREK